MGGLHIARFLGQKGVKANGEKGMLMFDDFIATAIGLGGQAPGVETDAASRQGPHGCGSWAAALWNPGGAT